MRVLVFALLATSFAGAQSGGKHAPLPQPPPAAPAAAAQQPPAEKTPEANIVKLTDPEVHDMLLLQRDVEDSEVMAYQKKDELDQANQKVQIAAKALNDKLDVLRKGHNLPPDTFFNQKQLWFVTPPKDAVKK